MAIVWDEDPKKKGIAWDDEQKSPIVNAWDKVVLGASDAISTVTGDSYGRSGDPLERDNLTPFHKGVRAVGGNILPAVVDAGIGLVAAPVKSMFPKAVESAERGVQLAMNSEVARVAGKGLDKAKEWLGPERTALASDALNIAGAFSPAPKIKPKFAARNRRLLNKSLEKQKRKDLTTRFEPSDPYDQGTLEIMDDTLNTKRFIPNDRYDDILDQVEKVPGVKSTNAHTQNRKALEVEVSRLRKSLDDKLGDSNYYISGKDLDDELLEAMVRADDEFVLQGDAGKSAQKLYEEFNKMYTSKIDDAGNISAKDLLAVRRELDNKIRDALAGDPFSPGNTASKVATRELRQSINRLVIKSAPDADVDTDLASMNKMLEARDTILPSTRTEGTTNIGRAVERLEERTGLKHPVSPLALQSNVSSPATVGLTATTAAIAMGGTRKIANALKKASVTGDEAVAKLIEMGIPVAERAIIIDLMNKDEEGDK